MIRGLKLIKPKSGQLAIQRYFRTHKYFNKFQYNQMEQTDKVEEFKHYKCSIPYVEDRYYAKPIPKTVNGQITRIEHLMKYYEQYLDQSVIVAGWARTCRSQAKGTLVFIDLTDGSSALSLQVVVDKSVANFEEISKCDVATSFRIQGKVIKSPAKGQLIEIQVKNEEGQYVKILGTNQDPKHYPMAKKGHTYETLRELAHLRPRSRFIGAIARIRNSLAFATNLYFQNRGFLYVHTPIVTASDCEGAGEMFQVTTVLPEHNKSVKEVPLVEKKEIVDYSKDFFKKPSFLTVSGQLAVENYCCALSNVYTFGPTFRAEISHTSRHLAEFWMIEPEMAFADLEDNFELAEGYLRFCIQYCLQNHADDLDFLEKEHIRKAKEDKKPAPPALLDNLRNVADSKFRRMTYTEGVEICVKDAAEGKVKFENKLAWGDDMNSEHERYIAEQIVKGPVILYNYPKDIKAFYMKLNDDGKTVQAMDVLIPQIGEVIGGSCREDNLEKLDKRIEEMKLDKESYWWYRDLRKYGSVPHCGFGLGFERLVMMVTGVENIKDVIPYPRYHGHAEF